MTETLSAALARGAREVAGEAAGGPSGVGAGGGSGRSYAVLADRDDGVVVRYGDVVAKAHPADGDPVELDQRLRTAAAPELAGVVLAPLRPAARELGGRAVTFWPYGVPVDPERPGDAPWEDAARLLAALHLTPVDRLPGPVPPMRGPAKVARALRRMAGATSGEAAARQAAARQAGTREGAVGGAAAASAPPGAVPVQDPAGAAAVVLAAARTLPAWAMGAAPAPPSRVLCHGDLHLGQLVRPVGGVGGAGWRLIDVDDLGVGLPAWDLARPAAWYAAGLLAPEVWLRFLDAYRAAGGPAAGPPGTDPWPELDLAARALTVQTAALAVAKACAEGRRLDDVERAMTDSCGRIATIPHELERGAPA
ncbi:phosphotransferase [Streptomyces sp. NPDC089799]|uniref:phosphotransferase family protein n=1 Tax=Streptomyces sp. NPDC089799 TaxID=3155066 RepID=UPI003413A65A